MQKFSVLILTAAFCTATCFAAPQDAAVSLAEPEYVRQFFTVGSDGVLVPLERAIMQHQINSHNRFISVKVESVQVIPGTNSSVRLSPETHFIVRMQTGDVDPTTLIHLVHLNEKKNERELVQSGKSGYIFAGSKNSSAPAEVPVAVKKYGSHSLEVIPSQPLASGEYAFLTQMQKADCFGVDPK